MLIGGFQAFTLSDYPGKPAAIVFTQGCNFRCPYCHNRRLWPLVAPQLTENTPQSVLRFLESRNGQLDGVVISGGEPTLQQDLATFLWELKRMGLAVKLDTNGSRPVVIDRLIRESLVDYIAMDIKAPLEKYHLLSGVGVDTAAIRESVEIINTGRIPHHFRITNFQPLLSTEDLVAVRSQLPSQSKHVIQTYWEPINKVAAAMAPKEP